MIHTCDINYALTCMWLLDEYSAYGLPRVYVLYWNCYIITSFNCTTA